MFAMTMQVAVKREIDRMRLAGWAFKAAEL
jgi:hypothetical protein